MKWLFVCFIIPTVFFNAGCQKNPSKKNSKLRCIYDQSVFAESCIKAVADETQFASFKRDPYYSLLYQGYSFEEGLDFLNTIEKEYPSLIVHFDTFRSSDLVGDPRTFDYGKYGMFSPTTLRQILIAGKIREKMSGCSVDRIIQIGAGYGGLCKILHDLGFWKSYTIVDLPEHLALARKVLERENVIGVQFFELNEIPIKEDYDLVVSDLNFSEFSRHFQKMFIDRVLLQADSGYFLGHIFPKHFGVEPLAPDELKEVLRKKIAFLEMHQEQGERADYQLLWKNRRQT